MSCLNPSLTDPSRLLIVRLSAFGDIIHTFPSYRALRRKFPRAAIDWLVEDRFAHILKTVEGLNEVVSVPRKKGAAGEYLGLRKNLSDRGYSAAIDFQGLTKSAIWPWLARIPVRVGYGDEDGREFSKWFYTDRVIPDAERTHVVERNLSLVEHVAGGKVDRAADDMFFPPDPEAEAWAGEYWERNSLSGHKVAAINPCAGWESKRWDAEGYAAVANWLTGEAKWKCLITWGPGEEEMARPVADAAEGAEMLPAMDIHQLAEVLRRCSLCVSGDTGPLHLAAAVGVPCVAVFGGSDPERNGPCGVPSRTVTFPVPCAPCWKTECPYGHRDCLAKLEAETVIEEIQRLIVEL